MSVIEVVGGIFGLILILGLIGMMLEGSVPEGKDMGEGYWW